MPKPTIHVRHQLRRKGNKIRSRRFKKGGYEHFKVRIYLEGDVDRVKSVEYQLHPTFPSPRRVVDDPSHGFALDIWTWGEFDIPVTIHFKDQEVLKETFELAYSDELPADDSAYTNEGPEGGEG